MKIIQVTIVAAAVGLSCASIQKSDAAKTERLLAAAGFQMRLANTPEKMTKLEAMTQRKLVPHEKDGKTLFVYADALNCKCVYAGSQEAHSRFQQLALNQKLANQAEMTASMNEDAAMDWGAWGGWYGPWY